MDINTESNNFRPSSETDPAFPLPKGCGTKDINTFFIRLQGMGNYIRGFNYFLETHKPREKIGVNLMNGVVTAVLQKSHIFGGEVDRDLWKKLSQIEPETGLRLDALLAQGVLNIKEGNLAVAPTHKLGIATRVMNDIFAVGGTFQFQTETPFGRVARHFGGNIIGIVINTDHPSCRPPKWGKDGKLPSKSVLDILNAIILAQKQLISFGGKPPDEFLTPKDLENGFAWLFSPKPK